MRILVIGAGIGGLQAAKLLAEGAADVTVFEKTTREKICYDSVDDVEPTVFEELNIPKTEGFFRTANTSFIAPFSKNILRVDVPDEKREWTIERRPFSQILIDRAEKAGAKLNFSTPVEKLLIEDGKVKGIVVNGENLYADLVIDSSGALSPFRASLPKEYRITPSPRPGEVFKVFRAFFEPTEGVEPPTLHTKRIYLKHLGEAGISWLFMEPDGAANVLIGRIDKLPQDTLDRALAEIRKSDPIIGTELIRGGGIYTIPIRYALPRMVGDGYAAIGDCAFMTVPMIGSGIANSLRAGKFLADTVLEAKAFDTASLWKYQFRYFKEVGAAQVSVDAIKRMLLAMPAEDIRFLFDSGIISEVEMNSVASGDELKMTFPMILAKIKKGWKKLGLLIKLATTIGKGDKAAAFAATIPEKYDDAAVTAWQNKLDGFFI